MIDVIEATTAKSTVKSFAICPPVPPDLVPQIENNDYRKCVPGSTSKAHMCVGKAVCLYASVVKHYLCCAPEEKIPTSNNRGNNTDTSAGLFIS